MPPSSTQDLEPDVSDHFPIGFLELLLWFLEQKKGILLKTSSKVLESFVSLVCLGLFQGASSILGSLVPLVRPSAYSMTRSVGQTLST